MYAALRGLGADDSMGIFAACPDANGVIDWAAHPPPAYNQGWTPYYDGEGCAYWVQPAMAGYTPEGAPIWVDRSSNEAQEFQANLEQRTNPAPLIQTAVAPAAAVPTWAYYAGAAAVLLLLVRR